MTYELAGRPTEAEILPPNSLDKAARALFDKMEHLDPSTHGDIGWDALTDFEREYYRACAKAVALQLANHDKIDGRS
ncbi:hypothetical protein LB543_24210 [Mesorhizobium sp. ESP7-2]|nr:hypothetical protein [Mesorhizobium sp. ESP7-2]